MENINEKNNDEKVQKIQDKLCENMLNLRTTIYSFLFKKAKKLKRPVDRLIFGFLLGYFSSRTEEEISEEDINNLIRTYIISCKSTNEIDPHIKNLTNDFVDFFFNDKYIDINSIDSYQKDILKQYQNNLQREKLKVEEKLKKCKICKNDFNLLDEYNYDFDCHCIIHGDCFDSYVINALEKNLLPIKCPDCNKEVRDKYIYESLKSTNREDLLDNYEDYYFNKLSHRNDLIICPTIGCRYKFFLDESLIKFSCPICLRSYCMNCKSNWHEGIKCEEYLKKYYPGFEYTNNYNWRSIYHNNQFYKQCPFCNYWNIIYGNNYYCNCKRCEHEFCLKCGKVFYGGRGSKVCKCYAVYKEYPKIENENVKIRKLSKRQKKRLKKQFGY